MWFQNTWHTAGRWCLGQGVWLVLRELGSINHPSVSVQVGSNCSWMQPHASGESSLRAAYVCTLLSPLPAGLLTSGDPLWVWWITGMTHSFLDWVRLAGQGRKHNTAYLRNERWCHFKKINWAHLVDRFYCIVALFLSLDSQKAKVMFIL